MKIPFIKERIYDLLTSETVGFSRIPEQARKISVIKGFSLNILVIGRRRSGTRTLINNLFLSPILNEDRPDSINTTCAQVTENGVKLNVRVSTCHDFDQKKILDYIKSVNFSYFESKEGLIRINNEEIIDKRIHICICLLSTDNLLEDEIKVIKNISEYTNLICLIGKADTYMEDELEIRKQEIQNLLNKYQINMFKPISCYELKNIQKNNLEQDEEELQKVIDLKYPLAVIASESLFKINGKTRRGRLYKWGFVDVNDITYNDFLIFRRILIGSNMEEIKEIYENKFYEKFRMEQMKNKDSILKFRSEKMLKIFNDWKNTAISAATNELEKMQIVGEKSEDVVPTIDN